MKRGAGMLQVLAFAVSLGLVALAAACEGPVGPEGVTVVTVAEAGPPGEAGPAGPPGPAGDAIVVRQPYATGPGLKLTITSASIDPNLTANVAFTVTDGAGTPLDLPGKYSEGPVVAKFVISALDQDDAGAPQQYAAYTTQSHTSVDGTQKAQMPDSDVGGTMAEVGVGQGTYTYSFGTKIPAGFDGTKTHTIGVWATRDFGGQHYVVNTLFDFVPSGSPVTVKRDIVNTQACNQCHNPLAQHEDGTDRREVALCILCHSPKMTDVSNGNALDMKVMVHKIHRGRFLPSVVAGGTYQLTEDDGTFDDHSDTWFPSELQNCGKCHKGTQGDVWKTKPSRAVCTSCHDLTSFENPPPAGTIAHGGGPATDDSKCGNCHIATSGTPLSIVDAHMTVTTDPNAPKIVLAIASVAATGPGQTPILHFTVTKNGQPLDILATPLSSLAVTQAGPTTDYADPEPVTYAIQGSKPVGTLALDGAVGSYAYTFPAPIPATATGTYAVGMEGYLQPDPTKTARYASENPVAYVAVTDAVPVPRRQVVDRDKCNSCHTDLAAHGGGRKSPEYCVLCHNPNKVNDQRVARFEVPLTTAPSVNFKVMVHKIHRGEDLAQGYVLGGFPGPTAANPAGTPVDFGTVAFPGNQKACWACHAGTSYMLPLPAGQLPTKTAQILSCADPTLDPTKYCTTRTVQSETFMAPVGAACTACHDKPATIAHAKVMTAPDGSESCETCHGLGKQWDVQAVHVLPP